MLTRAVVSGEVAVEDGVRDNEGLRVPPGLRLLPLADGVTIELSATLGEGLTGSDAATGGLLIGPVTLVER